MKIFTILTVVTLFSPLLSRYNSHYQDTGSFSCDHRIREFLHEQWFYNECTGIYRMGNAFRDLTSTDFGNSGCLEDLTKEEIVKFFGKPNEVIRNNLYYFTNNACNEKGKQCSYFIVHLNQLGKWSGCNLAWKIIK